jgi:hypothetical protein
MVHPVTTQTTHFVVFMLAAVPEHSSLVPCVATQASLVCHVRLHLGGIEDIFGFRSFHVLGWIAVTRFAVGCS